MNQKVKDKWVKALRSGDYKQGSRQLRTEDNTFCCLGVLCDLYCKEKDHWEKGYDAGLSIREEDHFCTGVLPTRILQWAGLPSRLPAIESGSNGLFSLSAINDSGCSFLEIADLIERNL